MSHRFLLRMTGEEEVEKQVEEMNLQTAENVENTENVPAKKKKNKKKKKKNNNAETAEKLDNDNQEGLV